MTAELDRAVAILREGGLVAFPTETVYGLGADASDPEAVARIFAAKGRPPGRAISLLLGRVRNPAAWAHWTDGAERLATAFWPGPLTLVLPRTSRVPDIVTGGLDTVGLRVPDHPVALDLLDAFGGALATPSANRSGSLSPTTAQHVRDDLGDAVPLVLDGGRCTLGVESTVLSLVGEPRVFRAGALGVEALEAVLGQPIHAPAGATHGRVTTPVEVLDGPALRQRLADAPDSAVLWWGDDAPQAAHLRALAADPAAVGRDLFDALRALDGAGAPRLLVRSVPDAPEWAAIAARLRALTRT